MARLYSKQGSLQTGWLDFQAGKSGSDVTQVYNLISERWKAGEATGWPDLDALLEVTGGAKDSALLWLIQHGYITESKLEGVGAYAYYAPVEGRDTVSRTWLSVAESADYLHVSERTIYEWVKQGALMAYRTPTGGLLRFRREDLDACMVPTNAREHRPITAAEAPVLAELWNNDADAAYDNL